MFFPKFDLAFMEMFELREEDLMTNKEINVGG